MMNLCKAIPLGHPCIFCTISNHQSKAPTYHLITDTKSLQWPPATWKPKKTWVLQTEGITCFNIIDTQSLYWGSSQWRHCIFITEFFGEKTCEPVSPQEPSQIRDSLQVLETVWHGFSISKTWWPSIISLPTNCRSNKETLPGHSIRCVFCFGFGRAYLRYVRAWSLHRNPNHSTVSFPFALLYLSLTMKALRLWGPQAVEPVSSRLTSEPWALGIQKSQGAADQPSAPPSVAHTIPGWATCPQHELESLRACWLRNVGNSILKTITSYLSKVFLRNYKVALRSLDGKGVILPHVARCSMLEDFRWPKNARCFTYIESPK